METERREYHYLADEVVKDLKESVVKLIDNQVEMGKSIVKLTEAIKIVDRLESRLIRLESLDREREKEQGIKIGELQKTTYKVLGGLTVVSVLIQILIAVYR